MAMILADLSINGKTHTVEFLHGNHGLAFVRSIDDADIFSQQSMGGPYLSSQGFVHLDQLQNVREEIPCDMPGDEAADDDAKDRRTNNWLGDNPRLNLYP